MTYSDFFHYAPFIKSWMWFTVYWFSFAVLIAITTALFWHEVRKRRSGKRWNVARQQFGGGWALATVLATAVFFVDRKLDFSTTRKS